MSIVRALVSSTAALLTPFVLVMLGVRLLLTPTYLRLEYARPGFPSDDYGFSYSDRLNWGTFGVDYIMNDSPPEYLGELRFRDGGPVFTAGEVSHMQDVKSVLAGLLRAWYASLALIGLFALMAWRAGQLATIRSGLRIGGLLTLGIAALGAVLGTAGASGSGDLFWEFFSGFHQLFFSGDSWLFNYSDTLIRLYPLRFWQDTILYLGVLTAGMASLFAFGLRGPARPSAGSAPLAQ